MNGLEKSAKIGEANGMRSLPIMPTQIKGKCGFCGRS